MGQIMEGFLLLLKDFSAGRLILGERLDVDRFSVAYDANYAV